MKTGRIGGRPMLRKRSEVMGPEIVVVAPKDARVTETVVHASESTKRNLQIRGDIPRPDIREASRELAEEMKKPPPLFGTANGKGARPGEVVASEFDGLVETVFSIPNIRDAHTDLVDSLQIGEKRTDYGTVLRALDEAETKARRAHLLYLGSLLEQKKWTIDADKTEAGMRAAAVSKLEEEKAHNDRTKRIVEADVDAKMLDLYPDEYAHLETKRLKVKGTVEAMERLAELWKGRCFSLRTILETMRK